MSRRVRRWNALRPKTIVFPLGYTNKFCRHFLTYFGAEEWTESLFEISKLHNPSKTIDFFFRGAKCSFQREIGLEVVSKIAPGSQIELTDHGWNGFESDDAGGLSYVDGLAISRFAPSPPGAIANESFRELESLLTKAIPFGLVGSLHQLTRREEKYPTALRFYSFKTGTRQMSNLADYSVAEVLDLLSRNFRKTIRATRTKVRKHIEID